MTDKTNIIVTAHCDKAARANNEDNCLVRVDIQDEKVNHTGDGRFLSSSVSLGDLGSLLILADGMGGMNAGEVASAIAVSSTSNYFTTQMAGKEFEEDDDYFAFINHAVTYADECIKAEAAKNPECSGLGTTIVVLWIIHDKAYIGWCGDSRIYRYNTETKELDRLSHDHSLVQYWVDCGEITVEEAFNHPQNNIIMRSLGDSPDAVDFEMLKAPLGIHSGDLFLLCSDGLCGKLRDNEIEDILNNASAKFPPEEIDKWNDMLWEATENAGWSDNVTSVLCYVQKGEPEAVKSNNPATVTPSGVKPIQQKAKNRNRLFILLAAVIVLVVALLTTGFFLRPSLFKPKAATPVQSSPTVPAENPHKVQ